MNGFVALGALAALVGVAAGAFGAHILEARLDAGMLSVYRTAVQYHLVHALGLLLVGLLRERRPRAALLQAAGWCLLAGLLLFCGSLYGMALTGVRGLGAVTPFGGVLFLVGWALVAGAELKRG